MRLAIDATPLLLRSAGIKNYLYYWIKALRELAGETSVVTFPVNLRMAELNHEGSMAGSAATLAGIIRLHLGDYLRWPPDLWFGPRPDVWHLSQQLWQPPRRTRYTATLHDVTCWLLPETHTARNVAGARRFAERVLSSAAGLIAVSEHTRADAVRVLGLPAEKIQVIHSGVAEEFFRVSRGSIEDIRARYALPRPYALFVGAIEPRKNLVRLLEAWEGISDSTREEHELVVAGPPGWGDRRILDRLQAGAPGVRYLGYVPERDLPALTAGATVFVYPSLYEGFGLPVAQAMAAGVPVLTSMVSALPEIAGDAAVLVDPQSVTEIRCAIERLLTSGSLRAELASRGVARAARFRWDRCARESLEFFRKVAGRC